MFKQKKQSSSHTWVAIAVVGGFCLMLGLSLFAYKLEVRYTKAMESKVHSQQGRIDELEKLLQAEKKN